MNIPQCGIKLHNGNFSAIGKILQEQLSDGKCLRLQVKEWREKRSLSQNALSHMWYAEISEYLINSGRTDATPKWVKRNLKKTYLGCEEVTYTDFITGEKTTTWEPRHTSDLDTGEMHIFLTKVEAWCAQFGLTLTIPHGCEYQQLQQKQEA
ncbi:TPA: YbcN family protein [Klebsiella pneumoniae]|nr:YbcN family protein [Klebsiella pneumoniae]